MTQIQQQLEEREKLIMAVESKFQGETRFETALRYIKERENGIELEWYAKGYTDAAKRCAEIANNLLKHNIKYKITGGSFNEGVAEVHEAICKELINDN